MQTQSSHVHRPALRTASVALGLFLTVLGIAVFFRLASPAAVKLATPINPPLAGVPNSTGSGTDRTIVAGGCFWGVQAVFQHTKGVTSAVSGYSGGTPAAPSYEQVSSGGTGHAESVEITFDPKQISFGRLLQIYFSVAHDPTQLNRQDPDEGTQYRSEIFATSDAQQNAAEAYIAELDKAHAFPGRIVTRVERLKAFYPAEPYHQDYATLHPDSPYIAHYDLPKIANLKKLYPEFYREQAVLAGGNHQ
ncbi:MAG: peptide-methionine (S)-S-oxide reductase MsrA [Pseudomonadota bacterium]|nr:peptide-methionine (S)-S-oxide reductase MsrA [Pseudomonadota bacterium]